MDTGIIRQRWRSSALFLALAVVSCAQSEGAIFLNGTTAHHVFEGVGGLSAGASSRLLFDYPEPYRSDILDLLFKPSTAASLHILKVEIGGDAQSTDGSEPSHMHTRTDLSCGRGYEGWLISEAKKRNPSIRTYGLSWAVPNWVGDGTGNGTGFHSPDNWLYQVRWLECIRNSTGYDVDFMGIWNEKPMGATDYVKGLRASMDAAGFSSTLLSVADNDYSMSAIIGPALTDPAFNASFHSVGRHYPCDYPYPQLEQEIGKAYWSSEDSSTANDWAGASCWARLLNQNYVLMNMTSTIAWSLIWAVPQGLPFTGNGLMSAQQPWSGYYNGGLDATPASPLNGPLWTTAQSTQFISPGWRYLHTPGGGSGFLPPSMGGGSYVTLVPPTDLSGLTIVIEKVAGPCKCMPANVSAPTDGVASFATGAGLPGAGTVLHVWRTNETHQFWQDSDITIGLDGSFSVAVPRDSIVTLSTVSTAAHGGPSAPIPAPTAFPVPYADNFDSYAEDTTPVKYFADQTGSWAARSHALTQVVPLDPGPNRWVREDVDPITLIGDPSMANVTVAVGVTFQPAANASGAGLGPFGYTYSQLCTRVSGYTGLKNGPPPGYCLALNCTGAWMFRTESNSLTSGQLPVPFDATQTHALILHTLGSAVTGWILAGPPPSDGGVPAPGTAPLFTLNSTIYTAGLVGLGSGYHTAAFDNFTIVAATSQLQWIRERY